MSLIGTTAVTLADIAKRTDPNGKIDAIVELLSQTNEILEDMPFVEGNLPTGHKTIIRTGLPTAAWRLLNYGVPQSKSKTQAVTDTCGMLEAYAEIDKSLADLNGNAASFRLSEDRAFLEAMNQEMAATLFYGDTAKNPERFLGLSARYSTLDKARSATAENIIDAGGTVANKLTSIWLICWGDQTAHGIYPKGSKAGFEHNDKGQVTLFDPSNNKYEGYRTHYKWDIGLTLRDWRYVVRVANIDLAAITDDKLVAGVGANDAFASKIFVAQTPLRHDAAGELHAAETFHVQHNKWETKSPMSTIMPFTENGKTYVAGAFACTPVVKYPLDSLSPGAQVKGKSVLELGSGNRPLDMFTYVKDGKEYVLSNTFRFHHERRPFGPSPYWTVRFDRDLLDEEENVNEKALFRLKGNEPATPKVVLVENYHGVRQMDRLGESEAVVLRETSDKKLELAILPLP